MFKRVAHLLLIIAFLGATGAHWTVLQSVAWAQMLADNAKEASLSTAIEKTFDGKHPCPLCRKIAQGRQSEKKSDFQPEAKKFDFFNEESDFTLNPPTQFVLSGRYDAFVVSLSRTPPVPPPRAIPA